MPFSLAPSCLFFQKFYSLSFTQAERGRTQKALIMCDTNSYPLTSSYAAVQHMYDYPEGLRCFLQCWTCNMGSAGIDRLHPNWQTGPWYGSCSISGLFPRKATSPGPQEPRHKSRVITCRSVKWRNAMVCEQALGTYCRSVAGI